jgi:SepF-like predicted cell division protein (DUF552 family)
VGKRDDVVYDPIGAQLEDIDKLLKSAELSITDLVDNPEAVQLLLKQQNIQLIELKSVKDELSESEKIRDQLRDEREELRIEVATLKERDTVSLMEIPLGIASGFAINILATDINNGFGWFLLIISLVLLAFIRRDQLGKLIHRPSQKERV